MHAFEMGVTAREIARLYGGIASGHVSRMLAQERGEDVGAPDRRAARKKRKAKTATKPEDKP
jgi:hypothetical protein